jgi:hypothetical protein
MQCIVASFTPDAANKRKAAALAGYPCRPGDRQSRQILSPSPDGQIQLLHQGYIAPTVSVSKLLFGIASALHIS